MKAKEVFGIGLISFVVSLLGLLRTVSVKEKDWLVEKAGFPFYFYQEKVSQGHGFIRVETVRFDYVQFFWNFLIFFFVFLLMKYAFYRLFLKK